MLLAKSPKKNKDAKKPFVWANVSQDKKRDVSEKLKHKVSELWKKELDKIKKEIRDANIQSKRVREITKIERDENNKKTDKLFDKIDKNAKDIASLWNEVSDAIDEVNDHIENGLSSLSKDLELNNSSIKWHIVQLEESIPNLINSATWGLVKEGHSHKLEDINWLKEELNELEIALEQKSDKNHVHPEYATKEELQEIASKWERIVVGWNSQSKIQYKDEWSNVWSRGWVTDIDFVWEWVSASVDWTTLTVDVAPWYTDEDVDDRVSSLLQAWTNIDSINYDDGAWTLTINASNQTTNPSWSNTEIQFNNNGSFWSDEFFTQDTTNGVSNGYGFNIDRVDPPNISSMTGTAITGTELGVGTYTYSILYVTDKGNTERSGFKQVVTTSGNQRIQLDNIPVSSDDRVIGRVICRDTVNRSTSYGYPIHTINDNITTTYIDSIPDSDFSSEPLFSRFVYANPNKSHNYIAVDGVRSMVLDQNLTTIGFRAWEDTTVWPNNTLVWSLAGKSITYAANNTVVGYLSLRDNITGNNNTAVGSSNFVLLTSGAHNQALWNHCFYQINGSFNIGVGYYVSNKQTSGSGNVCIGAYANFTQNTSGNYNILIWHHTNTPTVNGSNELNIGNTLYWFGMYNGTNKWIYIKWWSSQSSNIFEVQNNSWTELVWIDSSWWFNISGDHFVLWTSKTPSSASDTGTQWQIAWDADYIYVCTATDTRKRTAIATW